MIGEEELKPDLDENLRRFKEVFSQCDDIVFREFVFAQNPAIKLGIVYIDGLVDKHQLSDQIMRALALEVPMSLPGSEITKAAAWQLIKERGLCIHQVRETDKLGEVVEGVLSGDTVLLVDGHARAIINGARAWEARDVQESDAEAVVRGPREGFVETLRINTSLLRRRIKSPNLKIEFFKIGEVTRTDVALVYIRGIVNDKLVAEVKERLNRIRIDGILESGYIEELIEDNPRSPFSLINHTERPDKVAAYLLEGRVAVMVDGSPVVLTAPSLFAEYIQSTEDYYERFYIASAVRVIRLLTLVMSLLLPSLYVAVVTYHHELLPTALLLSVAAQREAVPFPAFVEVLVMEIAFEILREAGVRLPRQIGQAVSIVGALVVGDAAVRAGLVAPATVITVALTGISSFIHGYSMAISMRLLRFPIMVLAATLGLFGVISGVIIIVVHLCTLRSFGVPYLSPLAPVSVGDLKDVVVRAPWWAMLTRPRLTGMKEPQRQEKGLQPAPPGRRGERPGGGEADAGKR
ncbi:MAG: spore germination protein [Peptococcaceae bacterium]|nr:spore germination protein [Peptococcaceae bacterium]